MSLTVLSWNSQGNKSDLMWNDPLFKAEMASGDDVLLFVCEAGTPDWITPGLPETKWRTDYSFTRGYNKMGTPMPWFNTSSPGQITKDISAQIKASARAADNWQAHWIPWQQRPDVPPALRCSVALYWFRANGSTRNMEISKGDLVTHPYAGRPVFKVRTKIRNSECVFLFAHLPAGLASAKVSLPELARLAATDTSISPGLMIIGDLNINATNDAVLDQVMSEMGYFESLPGVQTQNKGGQLDWGAYNPTMRNVGVPGNPSLVWRCNGDPIKVAPPPGPSDHAMLKWVFP